MSENVKLSYHDCDVHTFENHKNIINIGLSQVGYGNKLVNVNIVISNPQKTWVDNTIASIWRMPGNDGEILTLSISDEMVLAIIEWSQYPPFRHYTMSYKIYGGTVDIRIV